MKKYILFADSGSTKTEWCVVSDGVPIIQVFTKGLNPYFCTSEDVRDEVKNVLMPQIKDLLFDAIYFYGAGCVYDKIDVMRDALSSCIEAKEIYIYSDLLAAAHSTCGNKAGIACILGTGSNSCFYDGEKIASNIPPLGFILGDEGGGAMLGRLLVSDVLKGVLPETLRNAFFEQYKLKQEDILNNVYKHPFPNRFLASLTPFLLEHIDAPEIKAIVYNSFVSFFKRNVMQYDYKTYEAHFVGSIAYHFKNVLMEAAEETGVRVGKVLKSPSPALPNREGD